MARTTYSPQFKAKLAVEVLSGEKELGTIAHENSINPIQPMRMSGKDVALHWQNGLKRSEEYLEHLGQIQPVYPMFDDAIQEILKRGVTIEQESFFA